MSKKKNKKRQAGAAAALLAMSAMMCAAPAASAVVSALPVFAAEESSSEATPSETPSETPETPVESVKLSDVGVQVRCIGHFEDGSPKFSLKLEDGGKTLVQNKDYKANVSTEFNGEYSVHIIGMGAYKGDTTARFMASDISNTPLYDSEDTDKMLVSITQPANVTYDGTAQTPGVEVSSGNKKLVKDKDYTVSYENNINAGTATVIVSGKNIKTASASFVIKPKSLGAPDIAMTVDPSSYTGETPKADTLKTVLKFGDTALVPDQDYTIEVANTDEGMTVKASGMNNFDGDKTFTVVKTDAAEEKDISTASIIGFEDSVELPEKGAAEQNIILQKGDKVLAKGTDYTVTYAGNTKAGTATLVLQGIGNYTGTIRKDFQVTEKAAPVDIRGAQVTITPAVDKDGNPAPKASVTYQGKTLTENTDYTVTYTTEDTNVVTKVTGIGAYTGEATSTNPLSDYQDLNQEAHGYRISSVPDVVYDGKAHAITIDDIKIVDKDGKKVDLAKGASLKIDSGDTTNAGMVKFTVTDKKLGSLSGSYNIVPADISKGTIKVAKTSASSGADTSDKVKTTVTMNGKELTENTDYTLKYDFDGDDTESISGKATVTGLGNYQGTLSKDFDISTNDDSESASSNSANSTDSSSSLSSNAEAAKAEAARSEYVFDVVTKSGTTTFKVPASRTLGELVAGLPDDAGWKNAVSYKLSFNNTDSALAASTKFSDLAPKIAEKGTATITAYDKDGKSLGAAVLTRVGDGEYQMKFDSASDTKNTTASGSSAAAEAAGKENDGKPSDSASTTTSTNTATPTDTVAEPQHTADPGTIPLYGMGLMSTISSALTGVWAMLKKKRM